MQQDYETIYYELGEDHWWFVSHQQLIFLLLSSLPKETRILDIGCADGVLLMKLQAKKFYNTFGIDISPRAIAVAKKRGLTNIFLADGEATRFESNNFDILIAVDILEHIRDDNKAIAEWFRILKPKGKLILFVPAFPFLWSGNDTTNHHFRRYRRKPLATLLIQNGFSIKQNSYWNFTLFFPTMIMRLLGRILSQKKIFHKGLFRLPPLLNWCITKVFSYENAFLRFGIRYPVGLSIFVIAQKN